PYIPTNNQKADSNDDSHTSSTDTKFTSTDESFENDTSQDAAIPGPSDKTKYQVVQQVVTTDKKLRPRSVVGLIVGWAIIFYSFYMFYQIHYASNSDSWAALGKAISGSMIQNTMVSTFWAGVACVAAYRLRCKYLHWLGCVLSVTAILQLPSITDIPILQIVAVVLPICAYTADTTAEAANESLKAKGKAQK
ncbi:MAG: hypothetical protein II920_10425, partial [Clostridia bacterium]|nr:hypothetical protein [Clostridia bacterium]